MESIYEVLSRMVILLFLLIGCYYYFHNHGLVLFSSCSLCRYFSGISWVVVLIVETAGGDN